MELKLFSCPKNPLCKQSIIDSLIPTVNINPAMCGIFFDHARTARYGAPVVTGAEGSEGEGAEGSGDAKHNRSPELRNIEELTVLFKFNRRQDSLSSNLADCQRNIIKALESMGVDIGMIGD